MTLISRSSLDVTSTPVIPGEMHGEQVFDDVIMTQQGAASSQQSWLLLA